MPLGFVARRRMVAELANREARRAGIGVAGGQGVIRGHMMDSLLSDLLPEGVRDCAGGEVVSFAGNQWNEPGVVQLVPRRLRHRRRAPRQDHGDLPGPGETP